MKPVLISYPVPNEHNRVSWLTGLKWMVAVMDEDDPSLGFISSCLSYAARGALTDKQSKACQVVLEKIAARYQNGTLAVQQLDFDESNNVVRMRRPRSWAS